MATQIKSKRVAIVTEFHYIHRGTEKLLDALLELFPNAHVFALFGNEDVFKSLPSYNNNKINFSILNKLPFVSKYYRYTYPLWPLIIEQFDFKGYDLVISISSSVAKGVIIPDGTYHISYINSPMRYGWDLKDYYFKSYPKVLQFIIDIFLHYLRIWDATRNNQINYVIANSNFIKRRIEKFYDINVDQIIYPFYEKDRQTKKSTRQNYYLYHGALEPNKGVIEVVRSAIKYGFPLIVSGKGTLLNKIRKMSKRFKNIQVLGWITDEKKYQLFSETLAFIFPSIEDFGIVALEAMSVGTPVLALSTSGTSEIINKKNGVLIDLQNEDQIYEGIKKLESIKFNREEIKKTVAMYTRDRFLKQVEKVVRRRPF